MSTVDRTSEQLTVADYEEVLADHRRLVRELDVLLNGEHGAAKQASLCDIVGQLKHQKCVPPSKTVDTGELWSFLRSVMSQGKDIHLDYLHKSYELYSARLDTAALERVGALLKLIGPAHETNGEQEPTVPLKVYNALKVDRDDWRDQAIRWEGEEKKRQAELAKWKTNCTGKHGSQTPCVESLPEEPSENAAPSGPAVTVTQDQEGLRVEVDGVRYVPQSEPPLYARLPGTVRPGDEIKLFNRLKDVWKGNAKLLSYDALNELQGLKLIEPSEQYVWAVSDLGRQIVGTIPGTGDA